MPVAYNPRRFTKSVTLKNWSLAASRWQDVSWNEEAFAVFVGRSPESVFPKNMIWLAVTEETARRVSMLTGPHYRAIIKAYLARLKGTEHEASMESRLGKVQT